MPSNSLLAAALQTLTIAHEYREMLQAQLTVNVHAPEVLISPYTYPHMPGQLRIVWNLYNLPAGTAETAQIRMGFLDSIQAAPLVSIPLANGRSALVKLVQIKPGEEMPLPAAPGLPSYWVSADAETGRMRLLATQDEITFRVRNLLGHGNHALELLWNMFVTTARPAALQARGIPLRHLATLETLLADVVDGSDNLEAREALDLVRMLRTGGPADRDENGTPVRRIPNLEVLEQVLGGSPSRPITWGAASAGAEDYDL